MTKKQVTVGQLSDVEVEYVSLVKRGANKHRFTIMKTGDLLKRPVGGPNPHDSLNQPLNPAEDAQNRKGGFAVAQSVIDKVNRMVGKDNRIRQAMLKSLPADYDADAAFIYMLSKRSAQVRGMSMDELEINQAREYVQSLSSSYDILPDAIEGALGVGSIQPAHLRTHAEGVAAYRAVQKSASEPLPTDSYRSAGELEQVRLKKSDQRSADDLALSSLGGRPLPLYLRR